LFKYRLKTYRKYIMKYSDPEKDFWPWHWEHDGKRCETIEDHTKAWQSIDWLNDTVFNPGEAKLQNPSQSKKIRQVSNDIQCLTEDVDISEKVSLADYQDYAIKKFDRQMQKIANEHPRLTIGVSGGIDSTMVMSWAYKNKLDFETVTWINDPWKGQLNTLTSENATQQAKMLGNKHHVVDYAASTRINNHDSIRQYCEADIWDYPQVFYQSEGIPHNPVWQEALDGRMWVTPIDTDNLFLHEQCTWNRFIPKKTIEFLALHGGNSYPWYIHAGYRIGTNSANYKKNLGWNDGYQMIAGWPDMFLYEMHKGTMVSPATSKEWWEMWHRIDEDSCSQDQLNDIMRMDWLKKNIVDWTGREDMLDLVRTAPCTEIHYEPDESNKHYISVECERIARKYYAVGRMDVSKWWIGMKKALSVFGKAPPQLIESIHTINWLEKNRSNTIDD
jgi:hypothetical protein